MASKHSEDMCPIRQGSYCSLCCSRGHSPGECNDSVILEHAVPRFLEQLIPYSFIEMYGIRTQTPIPQMGSPLTPKTDDILEVPETEEALRAILRFYDVDPMICQKKGKVDKKELKENKKRLQKVADRLGRRLVFAEPAMTLAAVAGELGTLFEGGAPTTPSKKKIAPSSKGNAADTAGTAATKTVSVKKRVKATTAS